MHPVRYVRRKHKLVAVGVDHMEFDLGRDAQLEPDLITELGPVLFADPVHPGPLDLRAHNEEVTGRRNPAACPPPALQCWLPAARPASAACLLDRVL